MTQPRQEHLPLKVVYDGDCALCVYCMTRLEKALGNCIQGINFRVLAPETIHPALTKSGCAARIHVIDGDQVYNGAHAIAILLRQHRLYRCVAVLYALPPFRHLGDWVYDFVARHRQTFSRWFRNLPDCTESCEVHHPPKVPPRSPAP